MIRTWPKKRSKSGVSRPKLKPEVNHPTEGLIMPFKINPTQAGWHAADVELIIDFLDELRVVLCQAYGEDIAKPH